MRKQYQWIQAMSLLFIVFAIYVIKINHTAGIDEIMTFFKYTRNLSDIFSYDAPNNHILHSFLVWLSTSLMGNSLIAIRLPAFFTGIFSLALIYRIGKRWKNHSVGLIAIVLMGITQGFFSYTVDGRGYTLSILFTLLLVNKVSESKFDISLTGQFKIFLYAIGTILVVPSNAFLIVAIIIWQLYIAWNSNKLSLVKNTFPLILSIMIGGTFYAILLLTQFPNGLSVEFDVGYRNLNGFIVQSVLILFNNPALSILLLGIFLLGVMANRKRYKESRFLLFAAIFIGAGLFSLLQWVITHRFFYPRNFLYLIPLVSLVGAIGIYRIPNFRLSAIISLALLVIGLWGVSTIEPNSHIRAWIDTIEEEALEGDVIFIGAGIYDPIYYHVSTLKETPRNYFAVSNQSNRFVFIPTAMTDDDLINHYDLQQYIETCNEEEWNSSAVTTCPITNGPYIPEYSGCFVSVYPYWRECLDGEHILNS